MDVKAWFESCSKLKDVKAWFESCFTTVLWKCGGQIELGCFYFIGARSVLWR